MTQWKVERIVHFEFGKGDLCRDGFVHVGFHERNGNHFVLGTGGTSSVFLARMGDWIGRFPLAKSSRTLGTLAVNFGSPFKSTPCQTERSCHPTSETAISTKSTRSEKRPGCSLTDHHWV